LRGRSTLEAQGALPLGVVQEIDSRSSAFAACGGRDHWLRQLPPAHLYLPLVQALDPEDLPPVGMSNERGSDVLACFAKEVASVARNLAELAHKGPVPVPGDAPGVARQRAMLQAAAAGEATELEAVAAMSLGELRPLAAQAFWACRERVMDQHFGQSGPRAPPHHEPAAAMAIAALAGGGGLSEGAEVVGSQQQQCWQRVPRKVAALRRPGGALRVNGYRLPSLSAEEMSVARFCLSMHTGAAGKPFRVSDLPGQTSMATGILRQLIRASAVELREDSTIGGSGSV